MQKRYDSLQYKYWNCRNLKASERYRTFVQCIFGLNTHVREFEIQNPQNFRLWNMESQLPQIQDIEG